MYNTKDSKTSLLCTKHLFGAAVKRHNKDLKSGDDKWDQSRHEDCIKTEKVSALTNTAACARLRTETS